MTELQLLNRAVDLLKQVPLPLLRNYDNLTAMLAEDIEQFCAGIVREKKQAFNDRMFFDGGHIKP